MLARCCWIAAACWECVQGSVLPAIIIWPPRGCSASWTYFQAMARGSHWSSGATKALTPQGLCTGR